MAGFSVPTYAVSAKYTAKTMEGAGAIKGEKGDTGATGKDGRSAYQIAIDNGFIGSESEWIASLKGAKGDKGYKGEKGDTGETGKSAYEIAKLNGYTGTVTEWLASLKGADGKDGATGAAGKDGKTGANGKSAYEIAVEQGYTGTEAEWIGSLKGKQGDKGEKGKDGADGKSFTIQAQYATEADLKAAHPTGNAGDAYYVGENTASSRPNVYIWLEEQGEWYNQGPISGVKGDDGASGKSAYELAEENGYSGSESEWLASLKGAKGDKGEKGDQGPQGEQGIQGLQGPQGIAGAKGDKGDTGANGKKGDKGEKGDAATIKVGKVVSGEAGTEAVVANSGTTSDAVFDFTIPRGDKGDKGDTGAGVPNGGTTGQILTKKSNDDGDVEWSTPAGIGTADEIADIVNVYGAKNLMETTVSSHTQNGITKTVNADGSFTLNGTATKNTYFYWMGQTEFPTENIQYTYSIETSAVWGIGQAIAGIDKRSETAYIDRYKSIFADGTTHIEGTFTGESGYYAWAWIFIPNGTQLTDVIVKGMIRLASIKDDTFVPYAKTNGALTIDKAEQAEVNDIANVLGAKNLIPYPYHKQNGYTTNGATFTYDDKGVITVNKVVGNSTAYFHLFSNVLYPNAEKFLEPNTSYILSMELENATDTSCFVQTQTGSDIAAIRNKATGKYEISFTTPETIVSLTVALYYGAKITENNAKVKLMIRLASIADDTYQPYAMTNRELTEFAINKMGRQLPLVNLGTEYTAELKADISSGKFEKAVVGGYLTINGHVYYFAHPDYWLHTGDTECTTHHMLVIPAGNIGTGKMNSTDITTGAYAGSDMKTGNNSNTALATAAAQIKADFGASNILTHRELFANAVTDGKASNWAWADSDIDLMNEVMVYGCNAWASHPGYETGIDKCQLKLFQERPDLITTRATWWLRSVVSASNFARVGRDGDAAAYDASNARGVRPAFAIC